jgi:hypothetical protein
MQTAPHIHADVARLTIRAVDQPTWQDVWRPWHRRHTVKCGAHGKDATQSKYRTGKISNYLGANFFWSLAVSASLLLWRPWQGCHRSSLVETAKSLANLLTVWFAVKILRCVAPMASTPHSAVWCPWQGRQRSSLVEKSQNYIGIVANIPDSYQQQFHTAVSLIAQSTHHST